ncbi:MAG: hypothetical protein VKQ33_05590 [Candidatus Sericytochromatia bacterium]|nr:hypothetical protein [Candidatus Sericytochromatia bacterium]
MPISLPNPLVWLLDYRLAAYSLQIVLCGGAFVLREFPYKEMLFVKEGYEPWNEHYENRLDLWESAVSIRLDRAMLPWLVVTPAEPKAFVAQLSERIVAARR